MLPPHTEPASARRRLAVRGVAALLVFAPLLVIGVHSFAATAKRWENPHGEFREDCGMCHRAEAWLPAKVSRRFDHSKYGFPLEGAHAAANCTACHATLEFKQSRMNCASCHEDIHRGEMGDDCSRCHSARSFTDMASMRRLHQTTRFPLTGGHAGLDCQTCHKPASSGQMQFVGTRAACADCHIADSRAARDPDHSNFSTECTTCHTPIAWRPARFDHAASGFPLTGAHRAAACTSCHVNSVYRGTSKDCASCHQPEYAATTRPAHAASGFPTACAGCHNTTAWEGATFDHDASAFPLTGAHRATACASCHSDGVYNGKNTACASCHQSDYNTTTSPKHTLPSFPATCTTCHGTTSWSGASINHDATRFPLTGAHRATACIACHGDAVYAGKPTDCYSCHQLDYTGVTDPRHTLPAFPTTCTSCHTTTTWSGASFNHSSTAFPLTGAHIATACASCHSDGVYDGKRTDCYSCHQSDYTGVTDPRHTLPAFPTTCTSCHTTTTWSGGSFNHATTSFPLTGAHTSTACGSCHGDGVYDGKSTACVSCHQADYNTAIDPNHPGAGISTTCTGCHTTTTWAGARVTHDAPYFKIYSGKHNGKWDACSDCHNVPSNYGQFTCLTCHTKSKMDSEHSGRSGYSYTSSACYSCHRSV